MSIKKVLFTVIVFLVLAFSRTKGHGFLKSDSGDDKKEFFHVSDLTGQVKNFRISSFCF